MVVLRSKCGIAIREKNVTVKEHKQNILNSPILEILLKNVQCVPRKLFFMLRLSYEMSVSGEMKTWVHSNNTP